MNTLTASLQRFFLSRYNGDSFVTQRKASIFLWITLILITLVFVAFSSAWLFSRYVVTLKYTASMLAALVLLSFCLVLLKFGSFRLATTIGVLIPIAIQSYQGSLVQTTTGKFIYLMYLLAFLPMAALIGGKTALSAALSFPLSERVGDHFYLRRPDSSR